METISNEIEKILNYKTYSNRRKVDSLLQMDVNLYTTLGTDSTEAERKVIRSSSIKIYNAIKKVDWTLGTTLLYVMDKK